MSLVIAGNVVLPIFAPDEVIIVNAGVTDQQVDLSGVFMFRSETDLTYRINATGGDQVAILAHVPEGKGQKTTSIYVDGPAVIHLSKQKPT
jgi:hypothetical protein